MKTERELFEEWFCNNHTGLKPNDLIKFRLPDGYSFRDPIKINLMWEAWQASAQRQGYKLVPVEPTLKMVRASENIKSSKTIRQDIYKAMIGVSE